MKKWNVAVTWMMSGTYEIEAETLKDAIEIAESGEGVCYALPPGSYIDDTFDVDISTTKDEN